MGVTWSVSDFEFVGAEPFDNASTFKAFIPSLKVNSDNSSGKLTSINLKFYRQSSSGSSDNVTTTFFETVAWNIFCVYALKTDTNKGINFPGSDSNISCVLDVSVSSDEDELIVPILCHFKIG